jgi:hypothetical protein
MAPTLPKDKEYVTKLVSHTDRKENFPHMKGNSDGGIGCKVIYEEGLPIIYEEMRKYLKRYTSMRYF